MLQKPAEEPRTAAKIPRSGIQGPGFASRRVSGVLPKTPLTRSTPSVGGSTKSISSARSVSASASASQGQASKRPLNQDPIRSRIASMVPMTLGRSAGTPPKSPASFSHSFHRPQAADAGRPVASPTQTVIPNDTPKTTPRDKDSLAPPALPTNPVSPTPKSRSAENSASAIVLLNKGLSSSPVARVKQAIEMTPRQSLDPKPSSSPGTNLSSQARSLPMGQSSNPFVVEASSATKSLNGTPLMNGAYSVPGPGTNSTGDTSVSDLDSPAHQMRQVPMASVLDESESTWAQSVQDLNGMVSSRVGGRGDEDVTFDMISDAEQLDEDMAAAIQNIQDIHTSKVTQYKRLLEQTQASSAQQLLALQAALETEKNRAKDMEVRTRSLKDSLQMAKTRPAIDFGQSGFDIVSAMRGDGFGGFDEQGIRTVVRAMRQADRMRLLHIILDASMPGDIPLMVSLLNKYALTCYDIIGHLPSNITCKVLSYLNLEELLSCELVSRSWLKICRDDSLYRILVHRITRHDPWPPKEPVESINGYWRSMYKALRNRELNWSWGNVQSLRFLKGHTGFCTTLNLKGNTLLSGSYDETLRLWDIDTGEQLKCLQVKAVSCVDYLEEHEVFAVGFHDVGRVQVFSSLTWSPLQTLQGHLYGIRAVAISPTYMVSAGADKAIVAWEWRTGKKIVRFGQQINMCIGVQIMEEDKIVSVTIDGTVRTFSINKREMLGQFQLNQLACPDLLLAKHLASVGVGPNNMLQWFAAKGRQMTCATKNVILHLTWPDLEMLPQISPTRPPANLPSNGIPTPSSSLSPPVARQRMVPTKPVNAGTTPSVSSNRLPPSTPSKFDVSHSLVVSPSILRKPSRSIMPSPRTSLLGEVAASLSASPTQKMGIVPALDHVFITPDVACGAVDPRKRRVVTSTRFSSRLGADRRVFVSTYDEIATARMAHSLVTSPVETPTEETPEPPMSMFDADAQGISEIKGAWSALAHGLRDLDASGLPKAFKGLATPELNPMALALNHEKIVVGCADGTIYVMSFVGNEYTISDAREIARANPIFNPAAETALS